MLDINTLTDSVDQLVDVLMNSTQVVKGAELGWKKYPNIFVYFGEDFVAWAETGKGIFSDVTPCLTVGGFVFYRLTDVEEFITFPKHARKIKAAPIQLELF